jgi:signal transduction histidine kinase
MTEQAGESGRGPAQPQIRLESAHAHRWLRRGPLAVAGAYALISWAYIAGSDHLLGRLFPDPEVLVRISLYKGFAFVGLTAGLLYLVLWRGAAIINQAFATVHQQQIELEQAQVQLLEANENLEATVAERTRDLAEALEQAQRADKLKSAFLATMSHELRTPLNSILGFSGILVQGMAGPLNPEQARQLGMVSDSARHLLELITDVLDLSKIEAGQLTLASEAFNLGDSLHKALETVRPQALAKNLLLEGDFGPGPGCIVSDRRRVEQILLNLLSNAVKFTEQGTVRLEVRRVGDRVHFEVRDTGQGIREEDLGNLFKPFFQVDSGLNKQHEGTGLGLSICRRLVSLLGGEIQAQSTWGQGSVFRFWLPTGHGEVA